MAFGDPKNPHPLQSPRYKHTGAGVCRVIANFKQQRSEIPQPVPWHTQPLPQPGHPPLFQVLKKDKRVTNGFPSPSPGTIKHVAMRRAAAGTERTFCPLSHLEMHRLAQTNGLSTAPWGWKPHKAGRFHAKQYRGVDGIGVM